MGKSCDTNSSYGYYRWVQSSMHSVPLVQYGWNESGSLLFYNERGFKSCKNGQGGSWDTRLQKTAILQQQLVYGKDTEECALNLFNSFTTLKCLQSLWVHMDGDSLSRDTYYDLLEALGEKTGCIRMKSHADQVSIIRKENMSVKLSIAFNPAFRPECEQESWIDIKVSGPVRTRLHPTHWIWCAGLWFDRSHNDEGDFEESFIRRLNCLGNQSLNHPEIKYILRLTSPYAINKCTEKEKQRRSYLNSVHHWMNFKSIEILSKGFGWTVFDTWSIFADKPELTDDCVHYTGFGSKAATNALLNIICPKK